MRTIKTIPALALVTSLASGALLLAATEGATAKNHSSHSRASELREVHCDHGHDGRHDHDHNSKHKDHDGKGKGKGDNKCGGKKKCPTPIVERIHHPGGAPALVRAPVQPSARASVISASSQAVRPWATPATALHRLPAHRVAAARVLRAAQAGIRSRTAPAQRSSRTEETTGWRRLRANPSITPAAVVERTHRRGLNASRFFCRAERARRPQVDVTQAPHQPVFVPTDRHCPLVARQQTRGVCDAASVLHGPSGSPGTKKSQTCVAADLRRLSFADCDSCRSHNGQGKSRPASRLGRPERRRPLIDLMHSDTPHRPF